MDVIKGFFLYEKNMMNQVHDILKVILFCVNTKPMERKMYSMERNLDKISWMVIPIV
jgi:hypothetical protein